MALHILCDGCRVELNESGGLLFSPTASTPEYAAPICTKRHFCVECFSRILLFVENHL